MKVLISKKTNRRYYYNEDSDYHCKEGVILEKDLKSDIKTVFSNLNREFNVFQANNFDLIQKMKRGPQIITNKDLGYIIARTRVNKNSKIVEAGSGSGGATTFFASIVKEVSSYDIVNDHLKITKKNVDNLKLDNVKLTLGDLKDYIKDEKDVDLLFLDMPEPSVVLNEDITGIKDSGYIVCYLPSISQVSVLSDLVSHREDLFLEEVVETNLRYWKVWGRISRPEFRKEIDHTAFLIFIRKI